MVDRLYHIGRRVFPVWFKGWLRKRGWLRRTDTVVWRLPAPLTEYQMTGPGVFGTYIDEPYEPLVVQVLTRLIQPGWTALDVGAHLGYFTLLLAHLVGEAGTVFAFEAHPENTQWLRENVALNELGRQVIVENLVISDGRQAVVRLNAPRHYTNMWSVIRDSPVGRSLEVQAMALDQYFAQGPHVDIIKVDIEGAEHMALQGMCQLLRRDRPICLVELHGAEGQMAARFLNERGYTLTDLDGYPISSPVFPSHVLAYPEEKD
jgi:FkbM family methyltransferase